MQFVPQENVALEQVVFQPAFTDCVPLSGSKSPLDQWGSPCSISVSPVSAASFLEEEEDSVCRIENAIVLDAEVEDEPRDRDMSGSDPNKRQGKANQPRAPSRGTLQPHNGQHARQPVITGTEDEARIRALKKVALRKQFEEHRKQKQMLASNSRR